MLIGMVGTLVNKASSGRRSSRPSSATSANDRSPSRSTSCWSSASSATSASRRRRSPRWSPALGIAIGAAWGGLLSNFAAGAFILVLRPFKVGDYVSPASVEGTVRAIGLFDDDDRHARQRADDRRQQQDHGGTIKNFSHNPYRRVDLTAQLDHTVDPHDAIARLKEALPRSPTSLTDSGAGRRDPRRSTRAGRCWRCVRTCTPTTTGRCTSTRTGDPRRVRRGRLSRAPRHTCTCAIRARDACARPNKKAARSTCEVRSWDSWTDCLGQVMGGMMGGGQSPMGKRQAQNPLLLIALQMLQQNGGPPACSASCSRRATGSRRNRGSAPAITCRSTPARCADFGQGHTRADRAAARRLAGGGVGQPCADAAAGRRPDDAGRRRSPDNHSDLVNRHSSTWSREARLTRVARGPHRRGHCASLTEAGNGLRVGRPRRSRTRSIAARSA